MRLWLALDLVFVFVTGAAICSCNHHGGGSGFVGAPAAAPTEELIFVSNRDGNDEIYSSTLSGGVMTTTRLTFTATEDESEPAWSPDGTKIVFVSDTTADATPNPTLFIMDVDGSNVLPLTTLADTNADRAPHWASDMSKIVFSRVDPTLFQQLVAVMDYPALTVNYVLANGVDPMPGYDPQFGPGDLTILFAARGVVANPDNNSDIFVVDAAGGVLPVQLTNTPGLDDFTPVYYAAQNQIAWVEWFGVAPAPLNESTLFTMNLDGSNPLPIHDVVGHAPDWPTGAGGTLYFSLFDGASEQVWKVDSPGVQSAVLLGPGDNFEPSVRGG